ncbi:MAG: uroporphyrinogen decarboxylase family protein [Fibrobacterota bacterium]
MTPRERFIAALERRPIQGRVPHFELEFFLTMEAFGRLHASHRQFHQWNQMSEHERDLHRKDVADLYISVLKRFELSGTIFTWVKGWEREDVRKAIEHARKIDGNNHFISIHGDATYSIPNGNDMMDFVMKFADDPQGMKDEAQKNVDKALENGRRMKEWGVLDGFCLCSDYCFNDNPFFSPDMFGDFVAPYLKQLVKGYRDMGYYVIKHTDGNIMPILDALVDANPHALQSLDPQGTVDIAEVKRRVGDKVCLIGNVNCAKLQTGTDDEIRESARYELKHGMPGYGYAFGTSNCIYTGLALERYELMLDVWRKEGNYK